ncbi:hypothetical protein [Magnetospirillum sp. 64-120]|uniref:hypothetical protein n=1 Tax=Magnetospirillum sp. 64-120 TaxID=1895778 RepID=UPI0025C3EDD7|nr:hypothetical protein [Magnetospirillum sp. 64-120]
MTFDFTPGWYDETVEMAGTATAPALHVQPAAQRAPSHPTSGEIALLVRELFSEGSLTWDQLQALSRVAELKPVLEPTLDNVPAFRRVSAHRQ